MVGVCGETGDVLALRGRGGNANPGRALGSFVDECVQAIPAGCRDDYQLWLRVDSAGYAEKVVEAAERHQAVFTITAKKTARVVAAIHQLALDPKTLWVKAEGAELEKASEIAECDFEFAGRQLRMIVRRQPVPAGEQLTLDDVDGWRFHAIITNIPGWLARAEAVEHHHRLRGGGPEEALRQLKGDFGLNHAPVRNFFGNWLWWHAAALAHNTARWVRMLALPESFRTCRGKRLRLSFFNVAAKVVRHGRRLLLRLPRALPTCHGFLGRSAAPTPLTDLRLTFRQAPRHHPSSRQLQLQPARNQADIPSNRAAPRSLMSSCLPRTPVSPPTAPAWPAATATTPSRWFVAISGTEIVMTPDK